MRTFSIDSFDRDILVVDVRLVVFVAVLCIRGEPAESTLQSVFVLFRLASCLRIGHERDSPDFIFVNLFIVLNVVVEVLIRKLVSHGILKGLWRLR